jgi:glycogen operon protein
MNAAYRVWPGRPSPLGATWEGAGVNFAIYSAHATSVELCLFDSPYSDRERVRLPLTERTHHVWHGFVPHLLPGQLYAFRVHGAWAPASGHRFNAAKLLMDPYARAIGRRMRWHDSLFGFDINAPDRRDDRDSAAWAPLAAVIDPAFTWGDDAPLRVPWEETVIYELHVRGFTKRHPDIPEDLRGTYLGLVSEPALEHLRSLGVTTLELMPIHAHVDEQHLLRLGRSNYWGYNTLSFFAPDPRYAVSRTPADTVREVKTMVRALHTAGFEVILDVVYNHTAEGSHLGPTLSWRGIDNLTSYRLAAGNLAHYEDVTGCGNTLNVRHPQMLKLVLDSLRYWVTEMHVDGFRFDLAPALAREAHAFDASSAFFDAIHQDPVLSEVKLIAEPWDLGADGFQVGHFPAGWSEWNPKYRDATRRYWRGDSGQLPELATRLAGSSDLFQAAGRRPWASINFVTCHDGFTLRDLVSYSRKHNEANGEQNRDGESHNLSTSGGVEGPCDDPSIERARQRLMRNQIATLLLSQGVPMLNGGDEIGRTQQGNNNAYCQDNEISWHNWSLTAEQTALLAFTRAMVALRHAHPVLQRRTWFHGRGRHGEGDLLWLDLDGREMTAESWADPGRRVLGMRVTASVEGWPAADHADPHAPGVVAASDEDAMLALFNAGSDAVDFVLPPGGHAGSWTRLLDTSFDESPDDTPRPLAPGDRYALQGMSVVLLRLEATAGDRGGRHRRRARRRAADLSVRSSRRPVEP